MPSDTPEPMKAPPGYRCLVIGPIGDELAPDASPEKETYEHALTVLATLIEPACKKFGFVPIRADAIRTPGDIPKQIYTAIRDWDLVIADLTGENPNVMYELALRHATGKCSISIAEWGRLPFDISHIRTYKFHYSEPGLIAGRKKLEGVLEEVLIQGGCDLLPVAEIMRGEISDHAPVSAPADYAAASNAIQADGTVRGEPTAGTGASVVESAGPSEPMAVSVLRSGPSGPLGVSEEDDLGFADILADMEDAMPRLVEHMQALSAVLDEVGADFEAGTAEITQATTMKERLLTAARVADQLSGIGGRLEDLAQAYAGDMARTNRGVTYILDVVEVDAEQREGAAELLAGLQKLRDSARSSEGSTKELIRTTVGLPHISKVFRTPSARVALALQRILDANRTIEAWGARVDALAPLPALGSANKTRARRTPSRTRRRSRARPTSDTR